MSEEKPTTLKHWMLVFLVAYGVMQVTTLLWTFNRQGETNDPPAPWNVDGIFYDNIAFNINRGEGFTVDLHAQPWRDTYLQHGSKNDRADLNYDWLEPVKGTGPTALRSPVYPYMLAGIYRLCGHHYWTARIFGAVCVSLGLAMLLAFTVCRWGYLAGLISTATLAVDFSVMQSAGTLATESLAVLIFAITFLLVVKAWEQPSFWRWGVAGISFASLMLTRGIWSLGWLVLIGVTVLCLIPAIRKQWHTLRVSHLFVFLATTMLIALPWWIRNCQTTGHFTPFGTAGSCGFVGGYCDESLANYGQWQADVYNRNQIEVQQGFDMDTVNLAHLEYAIGQSSIRKTKTWCLENWTSLPILMSYRALSHWGLFNDAVPVVFQLANVWLVLVGLIGCFLCTGNIRRLFLFVLLLDMVLVMLTWEHLGRYAIPIRPLVHLGYGVAISQISIWSWAKMKSRNVDG